MLISFSLEKLLKDCHETYYVDTCRYKIRFRLHFLKNELCQMYYCLDCAVLLASGGYRYCPRSFYRDVLYVGIPL